MEDKDKTAREACDILNEACAKLDENFSGGGEKEIKSGMTSETGKKVCVILNERWLRGG